MGMVAFTAIMVFLRPPGAATGRLCLILSQWILVEVQVGLHIGFESPIWIASFLLYSLSFVSYKLGKMKTDRRMPWHRPGLYGWHEDFHNFLFAGDLLLVFTAAVFLMD